MNVWRFTIFQKLATCSSYAILSRVCTIFNGYTISVSPPFLFLSVAGGAALKIAKSKFNKIADKNGQCVILNSKEKTERMRGDLVLALSVADISMLSQA